MQRGVVYLEGVLRGVVYLEGWPAKMGGLLRGRVCLDVQLRGVIYFLGDSHLFNFSCEFKVNIIFRQILSEKISLENYNEHFSLLLHYEELQMEVDIREYDMKHKTMKKVSQNLLELQVCLFMCKSFRNSNA